MQPNLEHFGLGGHQNIDDHSALGALHAGGEGVKLGHPLLPVFQLCPWTHIVCLLAHLLRLCQDLPQSKEQ